MDYSGRISSRSAGQFDPMKWIEEGDGLMASSLKTREIWTNHQQTFVDSIQERKLGHRDRAADWNLLAGLPRASVLLLGYSVEMYLKSGLARAYFGCSEEMFARDVKDRFGHKMFVMAKEIEFALEDGDQENLDELENMVLVDARYPIFVPTGQSYTELVNQQTARIWSSENFEGLVELVDRIKEHSQSIDADPNNPAWFKSVKVDDDGYFTFRVGGNLPPRITYRLSSVQKCCGETSVDDVKVFCASLFPQVSAHWEQAWIYEDGGKGTYRRAQPSN